MNAPVTAPSPATLLLIDVINPMDFEGGKALLPPAKRAAERIARLKQRARDAGVAVVYVNDNFDCWHLGFHELVEKFKATDVPGLPIIRLLDPDPRADFYILKPSQSGFFRTGLEVLLDRLDARTLILTGFATDICVLFTAFDAYMRGFHVVVAKDCVASERESDDEHALRQMARLVKAQVVEADEVDFLRLGQAAEEAWTRRSSGRGPILRP